MIKPTLLDMTQSILSEMGSDEVNSISDTAESLQVANIIKNKYNDIIVRGHLPEHNELFQLDPSNDNHIPVLMFVPAGVNKIDWLQYFNSSTNYSAPNDYHHDVNIDIIPTAVWSTTSTSTVSVGLGMRVFEVDAGLATSTNQNVYVSSGLVSMQGSLVSYSGTTMTINVTGVDGEGTLSMWNIESVPTTTNPVGYEYVNILPLREFLDMVDQYNTIEDDVSTFTFTDSYNSQHNNFTFAYKTQETPRFCTLISNHYIIFNAYDSGLDTTLQASKTRASGLIFPVFELRDDFIPDIDEQIFPLLLNESKALAFYVLKQQPHAKAEQEIKRQWSSFQKDKSVVNRPTYFNELSDFGRRGGRSHGSYFKARGWRQ